MGKLRRRWENGGGGWRSGDVCCGKVLPPAVSVLAALCCQGWGPEPGPPLLPRFTRWDRGGGAGPRNPLGAACSAQPLPALPPSRWAAPPKGTWGRSPRRGPRCGRGGRRPGAPGSPFPPRPFLPVDLGTEWIERGDSLAEEREKRSAPCRFCKIAVTTLCPGCGWEKGRIGL